MSSFPVVAITNYHKPDGFKQQFIPCQQFVNQDVSRATLHLEAVGTTCSLPLSASHYPHTPWLASASVLTCPLLYVCVSLCLCLSLIRTLLIGFRTHLLLQGHLLISRSLTLSHLDRPFFQIRWPFQALGISFLGLPWSANLSNHKA